MELLKVLECAVKSFRTSFKNFSIMETRYAGRRHIRLVRNRSGYNLW